MKHQIEKDIQEPVSTTTASHDIGPTVWGQIISSLERSFETENLYQKGEFMTSENDKYIRVLSKESKGVGFEIKRLCLKSMWEIEMRCT